MKNKSGFTIVELVIVITVIAILVAIGSLGFTRYQQQARNVERHAKATIITESLEKYYDTNGEYPGCTAMTQPGESVRANTLRGIELDILITPKAPKNITNSIVCSDITASTTSDVFAYVGDGSSQCQTGQACQSWIFRYKKEGSNEVISIKNRRTAAPTPITVAATISQCDINGITVNWTSIPNANAYQAQVSTSATFQTTTFSNTVGPSSSSVSFTDISHGTTYYVRVKPFAPSSATDWSTATTTTGSNTCVIPTATTVTATATQCSMTGIRVNWTTATNAYAYQAQVSTSATFQTILHSSTVGSSSTTLSFTNLSHGTTYYVRVQPYITSTPTVWSAIVSTSTSGTGGGSSC